jgi:hypothetical protein
MAIRNKCYNSCFYLHDRFSIRKLFLVRHGTLRILSWWAEPIHIWIWMPNMKNLLRCFTTIAENLNAWNLLSVRHFVYMLLFHVHLPRFGDIIICLSIVVKHRSKFFIFGIQIHIWIGSAHHESIRKVPWRASAREIATCKQNVGQKEDFMHSNFQMDISLPWIDAAFT